MPHSLTEEYISINTRSSLLEDKLCPPRQRTNPSIFYHEANINGSTITSDYNQLIYRLKKETVEAVKFIPLLADTHCNLAQHFDVLSQFFHACYKEALEINDTEQAEIHLNQAISNNKLTLDHIRTALKIYLKPKDIKETNELLVGFQATRRSLAKEEMNFKYNITRTKDDEQPDDTASVPSLALDTTEPESLSLPREIKKFRAMVERNNRLIRERANGSSSSSDPLSIFSMFNTRDGLSPDLRTMSQPSTLKPIPTPC